MFIIGDEGHYHGRFPWVTASLVAINVLVFSLQCSLGEKFTNGFSMVPAEITEFRDITKTEYLKVKVPFDAYRDRSGHVQVLTSTREIPIKHFPGPFPIILTLFTSMFMHGDIFHLVGNMWFLLVFGRNVECALDHGRFLVFYTLCGTVGGLAHIASDAHSIIPCLGASGAISGVMGAYVAIHPFNKVKVWLGWLLGVVQVPALVVIGFWFLMQYISAFLTLEHPELSDGVAYWDHIGGFLTGLLFIWGTVLYLKWEMSKLPPAEEADLGPAPVPVGAAPSTAFTASGPALPDPFANFMPPK